MQHKKQGFSLIEVLISLLLISLILLGLDGMQLYSWKLTKTAYFYNVATNQLNNVMERLTVVQTADGFMQQVSAWNIENKAVLPMGYGTVTGAFPNYITTIYWGTQKHNCIKNHVGEAGCLREKIQLV